MNARRTSLAAGLLAALTLAQGCISPPEAGGEQAETLYGYCEPCHGPKGAGRQEIAAPAIAGLPAWYVVAQLDKFRAGLRGAHATDLPGQRMRPMSMVIKDHADLEVVAAYVSGLPPAKAAPTVQGDAEKGKQLYAVCTACHGADGKGNRALNAPPLTGTSDWYLVTQLGHFKAGRRGADPKDATGAQMRPMAMTLADEQAMKDVVAYINTLK